MKRFHMSRGILCVISIGFALCLAVAQERSVTGEYRNNALGFGVKIPSGLRGLTGDQAGPERGVKVFLPSGSVVAVFGEPNSLEYKTAAEGIRDSLSHECDSDKRVVSAARVGEIQGARGKVVCGDRMVVEMLVIRPGGSPIYWLTLHTAGGHAAEDEAALEQIAAGFKLIAWR